MTRINLPDPVTLTDEHLFAEWRELPHRPRPPVAPVPSHAPPEVAGDQGATMTPLLDTKAIRATVHATDPRSYVDAYGKPLLNEDGDPLLNDHDLCESCGRDAKYGHFKGCAAFAAYEVCVRTSVMLRNNARNFLLSLCDELDELRATLANERGEGPAPGEGWTWSPRADRDMVGAILRRYHAWLWGPDDTGFEVLREPDGRWSVALETDRISYYPTAREAMRAAMTAADKTRSPA